MMDQSGNGGTGLNGAAPTNPTDAWWYHMILNHANNEGYYFDIAANFHSDDLRFRRNTAGALGSWQRIFADNYHPNADKLTTARTISLAGDASGSISFDGSANKTLTVTIADDSHNHTIANVDGLQTALNGKLASGATAVAASKLATARTISLTGDASGSTSFDGSGNASISVVVNNDSHYHSQVYIQDTRGAVRAPSYYPDRYVSFDFQQNTDTGAGNDQWHVLQTINKWSSYNIAHRQEQLAYTGGNIKHRIASSDSAWGSWKTLAYTSDNVASATKLATARTISLGGDASGSITFDGTANKTLTVVVNNDSHTHDGRYYTESESDGRFGRLASANTWTTTNTFNGTVNFRGAVDLADNDVLRMGSGDDVEFHFNGSAFYTDLNGGYDWYIRDGNSSNANRFWFKSDEGTFYATGAMYASSNQRVFADNYHPNADKLTTARTIALSGDATGSVSFNGSANVTIAVDVNTATWADTVDVNTSSSTSFFNICWHSGDTLYSSNGTVQIRPSDKYMKFGGAQFSGEVELYAGAQLHDNDYLWFGTGKDVEFFCNGSHMYTDLNSGIGNWYIRDGSTNRFTFDDAGHFTASGEVYAYSDARLKSNVVHIEDALDKVMQLNGYTYDKKRSLDDTKTSRETGVIAQEVERVLPEAIRVDANDEDRILSVAYGNMIGLLIEAIKEQQHQIQSLQERVVVLEAA